LKAQIDDQSGEAPPAASTPPADSARRIEKLEQRVTATEQGLEATASALESRAGVGGEGWWNSVAVGGYGSSRFEASNLDEQDPGFTFRRFVLALDARPTDRLETYLELEFERFTELELEKGIESGDDEIEIEQAIEGGNGSEISIEQAWTRYTINPALRLDFGALLMPVGRFNLNHDDNQWVLPRRSLVDRGAPVLPSTAAWTELGAGISGSVPLGETGLIDYRLYAVNGTTVDFELENELEVAREDGEPAELESVVAAEFGPSRGAFDGNDNDSVALAGRLALSPTPSQEVAVSGYVGNYVPSFLGRDETLWSVGLDGVHHLRGLELEYEAVMTHFDNVDLVAAAFADRTFAKEREINGQTEDGAFATQKVELTLSQNIMAKQKTGYWVELRYPFWTDTLDDTFLGRGLRDPKLIPTVRMEQVFYDDQLTGIEFDGGAVTAFGTRDAHINRATLGLGYRPTPAWALQLTGEYTWTNEDSLAGLTNFLAAEEDEDDALSVLLGVAFGF
ncbi:MAG TPA: hypothetical protein VE175_13260, partial [Woeseiaceae bacterium]|nr:hypothetical protein [Woeseiaceae bacterium]